MSLKLELTCCVLWAPLLANSNISREQILEPFRIRRLVTIVEGVKGYVLMPWRVETLQTINAWDLLPCTRCIRPHVDCSNGVCGD